jgi:hypothetical protein
MAAGTAQQVSSGEIAGRYAQNEAMYDGVNVDAAGEKPNLGE